MEYRVRLLIAALLCAAGLLPAAAAVRVVAPVKTGGFGAGAGGAAGAAGGINKASLTDMPVKLDGSLPALRGPEMDAAGVETLSLPESAVPAPVAAAAVKAAAGERAAREELGVFLRRSAAVERRNAELKAVQDKMRTLPVEERGELIARSNRLQELALDDLIERYFPVEEADSAMGNLMRYVQNSEVTINFDPNMKMKDGRTIVDGITEDGVYRSYAETGVTQGVATQQRAAAEEVMFAGLANAPPSARPKYAALNLTEDPAGGAPRYSDYTHGKIGVFFALKDEIKGRSTLTARDTLDNMGLGPVGSFASPAHALKDMPKEYLLALYQWIAGGKAGPRPDIRTNPEVQVFDTIRIGADVKYIGAHRSLRGSPAETRLQALADKYNIELRWY